MKREEASTLQDRLDDLLSRLDELRADIDQPPPTPPTGERFPTRGYSGWPASHAGKGE